MENDPHPIVQRAAANALGQFSDTRVVKPLILALASPREKLQQAAQESLKNINPNWAKSEAAQQAIPTLIAALTAFDEDARKGATKALQEIDSNWAKSEAAQQAVPTLIAALAAFSEGSRAAAASALRQIDPNWLKLDVAHQAIPKFIETLKNGTGGERAAAAKVLGQIGDEHAIEPLILALKEDSDSDVRKMTAQVLGDFGNMVAVEALILALTDKNIKVHEAALGALEKLDPNWAKSENARKAVPSLVIALKDVDAWVRQKAAHLLTRIGDTTVVGPLIETILYENTHTFSDGSTITASWPGTVQSLVQWLQRDIAYIAADDLRSVLKLPKMLSIRLPGWECEGGIYDEISFSEITQLARQELIRRGEKA